LTHIVSKTFAGIGVLDFRHNGSVAFFKDQPATTAIKVLTGLGCGWASAASDWSLRGCLVYGLVALAVGQKGGWRTLLSLYAVGAAGIVTAKNIGLSRERDLAMMFQISAKVFIVHLTVIPPDECV
jgi:hypothetical protein